MKAYLAELVRESATPARGRNVVREYLQARILGCLQHAGAMIPLAFHGGTALRFLYAIRRHSEDLDFALERSGPEYDFRAYLRAITTELTAEGYVVEVKVSDRRVVHSAFVRFAGLLHELGLSPHRSEVFSVKIEVDTKGRDIYDLVWYLSDPDWPAPNLTLLNNALRQTGWSGPQLTQDTWREVVSDRLQVHNWDRGIDDVRPFLESPADVDLLTRENVRRLLG